MLRQALIISGAVILDEASSIADDNPLFSFVSQPYLGDGDEELNELTVSLLETLPAKERASTKTTTGSKDTT